MASSAPWWECCCLNNINPNWYPSRAFQSIFYFLWIIVQIGIILAKVFVPQWADWYGLMQGFHLYLLLLQIFASSPYPERMGGLRVRRNFFVLAAAFLFLSFLLSYHSIMSFLFSDLLLGFSLFWPWFVLLASSLPWCPIPCCFMCCCGWVYGDVNWYPSTLVQRIFHSLWSIVQIGIIVAIVYIPQWFLWYRFMQGFSLYTFLLFLFAWSKYPNEMGGTQLKKYVFIQAAVLNILTMILSYTSIVGFILSGILLGISLFFPFFIFLLWGSFMYVKKCYPNHNDQ